MLALSLFGFWASACGGTSNGDGTSSGGLQASLNGRTFVSESVEGWDLVPGSEIRIGFGTGTLRANGGCNSITGEYTMTGATLVLQGYGMTLMGCDPGLHHQEDWLVGFLEAGPRLELNEPRLTMSTADARMVLLDREVASPDRPLVGTQWIGQGYSDGQMATGGTAWPLAGIVFAEDGSVTIDTSCQKVTASYASSGSTITFQGLAYDSVACADPTQQHVADRVQLVLDGSAVDFDIQESLLILTNGSDSLDFRAAN